MALLAGFGAVLTGGAGCGDNLPRQVDVPTLAALPGVHDVTEQPTQTPGFHYFVLHFTQPVDHDDPTGATFLQEVSLLHRDTTSPMIVHTSGYWDYYLDHEVELTSLLAGNQISIEHRYFAGSRPQPPDWSKLTIKQMAQDEHAIVTALKQVYVGPYISTGGSKGGMTAIFYRRFFPDDVDGTVPYVAPISFSVSDPRYPPFIAQVGTSACRQHVRDLAVEMLSNRRAALEALTEQQATQKNFAYTRVLLGPSVESAIVSFEWSFWQYYGVTQCASLPAVDATDAALFGVLDTVSPPSDNDDEQTGLFDAYYYQAFFQLGYPADGTAAYLLAFESYSDADYAGSFPTAEPAYDGGVAMDDIANFVATQGDRFVFVYGQWDPWSAGAFDLGGATDSLELVQAQGTHNSHLATLAAADEQAALAKLSAWTGRALVVPMVASARIADRPLREPHVPPAYRRALRGMRRSH
ncbi:MAG: S28 family serine protease [Kofleriaceae bacterium]